MKFFKEVLSWVIPVVVGLVIGFGIKQFVISANFVDGDSMQPNLQDKQMVVSLRQAKIHRNSVIVFDAHGEDPQATPKDYYVKRVIGLPGDTINSQNGNIYVNHTKLYQGYIGTRQRTIGTGNWNLKSLSAHWVGDQQVVRVPKGKYFVLGDHRSVSDDSRYWGFVDQDKIEGVTKAFPFQSRSKQINRAYQVTH